MEKPLASKILVHPYGALVELLARSFRNAFKLCILSIKSMPCDKFPGRLRNHRKVTGSSDPGRRALNAFKTEQIYFASEILLNGLCCLIHIGRITRSYCSKERYIIKDLTGVIPCLKGAKRIRTHDPEEFMGLFSLLFLDIVPYQEIPYIFFRSKLLKNNGSIAYAVNAVLDIAYKAVLEAKTFNSLLHHEETVRGRKLICIELEIISHRRNNDHKVNETALQCGIYHCYVTVMNGIE